MRVNYFNIDYQFDLWYIVKFVSKKLFVVLKKFGCFELVLWILFIVNYLWWFVESCGKDLEVLKERWLLVIYYVINRYEWLGNRYFYKCEYGRFMIEEQ